MSTPITRNRVTRARKIIRRAFDYRSVPGKVAQELGLSRNHVWRVVAGERQSARVEAALVREVERVEESGSGLSV